MPLSRASSKAAVARGVPSPQASVAERLCQVELTANFLERLEVIEAFLAQADAALKAGAYPQAAGQGQGRGRSEGTGHPQPDPLSPHRPQYLDCPPQSAEALAQLSAMPAGAAHSLREYLHGDYLMLYTAIDADATVYLLSVRHHRQLSFDFERICHTS